MYDAAGPVVAESQECARADSFGSILASLRNFVRDLEPASYASSEVAAMLKGLSEAEKLCGGARLLMARRAHELSTQDSIGAVDPAQLVATERGEPVGRSRRDLATARRLASQPQLEAALRDGSLSTDQAAVLSPAIEADPRAADRLIRAAKKQSFRELAGECEAVIAATLSEQELIDREARLRERRHLRIGTTDAGAVYVRGELPPVDGAAVKSALEATAWCVREDARRQNLREAHDAYMADALVRLCRAGRAVASGSSAPDSLEEHRATEQVNRVPRAEIVLHVDVEALRRGQLEPGERCEIEGVGPVPVSTVEYLFGNAWTKLIITRGVDIASVTHLGRNITAHQDSALRVRDRVCSVPGCGISYGLERDHIVEVQDHGPTELDNLVRLCKRHHYLKTHRFWRLIGRPGAYEWVNIRFAQPIVAADDLSGVAPPLEPAVGLARPPEPLPPLELDPSASERGSPDDAAAKGGSSPAHQPPPFCEQRLFG
jgi:hypothetical protein